MDDLLAELTTFDVEAPLPGAPDPWEASSVPAVRDGPPYAMTEMIAAEPALAARIVSRLASDDGPAARLAASLRGAAQRGAPVVVTGCGTSEHGALAIVELLREAWSAADLPGPRPSAAQAFELSLDPPPGAFVLAISHEGGTPATNAALEATRRTGGETALITASAGSPGAAIAHETIATAELDRSWCHTVGYLSPIVAGAVVADHLVGRTTDPAALRRRLEAGIDAALAADATGIRPAESIARRIAEVTTLLVIGSGADRPAARELVLKIEEATWLPSAMRDLETFLHGHLPATDARTGLVLLLVDPAARDGRVARARQALEAARRVGILASGILASGAADEIPAELTPAGRIVVPEAPGLPAPVAALLGSATALQLLTERLARVRGTNPDPIRRDDARYREAAEAAEG